MLHYGIFPGPKGREYLLKMYITGLCFQSKKEGITYSEVSKYADQLEYAEFGVTTELGRKLTEYLFEFEAKINVYTRSNTS